MDARETFGVALSRHRNQRGGLDCYSHGQGGRDVGTGNHVLLNVPGGEQFPWNLDPAMESWGGGWGTWPFTFMHAR